ncbi:MAG: glutathione S-transferase family protein [Gammaproteobacteria bacterium]|nr:glutathione S-transferase family protein [Gammaproteobacteria bacterium]
MLGDHLREKMKLYGHPQCANTAKVLFTAAEKGVDIESHTVDPSEGSLPADLQQITPYGAMPVLVDVDFVVYGTPAIMSYLDDKGFGPSLLPRNGVVRAINYQWAFIATEYAQPQVTALMSGDGDKQAISKAFDGLEQQLQTKNPICRGDYICGAFTLADIHWAAVAHGCELANASDIVTSRPAVNAWWGKVKTHPSTSKEKIVAYDVLPTAADVQNGTLRDIQINA